MTDKPPLINVLFCDDDSQFAANQVESLLRKAKTRYGLGTTALSMTIMTNLQQLKDFLVQSDRLKTFDMIFCDLGWADLTLEGIQILHDIQMAHPGIYAVLYTAQDEDAIIGQALQWKLDFVDQVIKVEGEIYFEKMLQAIVSQFHKKRVEIALSANSNLIKTQLVQFLEYSEQQHPIFDHMKTICEARITDQYCLKDLFPECEQLAFLGDKYSDAQFQNKKNQIEKVLDELISSCVENDVEIFGAHHIEGKDKTEILTQIRLKIEKLKKELLTLTQLDDDKKNSFEMLISSTGIKVKIKPHVIDQTQQRYLNLIEKLKQFPRIENHELLALDKVRYINFVNKKYGGFPQMAKDRRLDLNNLYRVNRRFKRAPFVVFQYDTIQEIIGTYDAAQSQDCIKNLLASQRLIHMTMQDNLV